jgi:Flp pilus assembly CpaF family ATPase/ferredoxin
MYLKKTNLFSKDTNVFLNCPYNFEKKDSTSVFNCSNCKNAPCIFACKQNAIFYISNGIVSIDQDRCIGCGECLKACPHDAIVLKKKKAYKCDLCANVSFSMFCYKNNKELLELVDDLLEDEKSTIINRYLGYALLSFKDNFLRELSFNVIETKDNIKKYVLNYPILSLQEIEIINFILDSYKNRPEIIEKQSTEKIKEEIEKELIDYCYINNIELEEDQFNYILEVSFKNLYFYGPLTDILNDSNLEEIVILGENKPLYVYHKYQGWLETNLLYTSIQIIKDLINKLSWHSNKYITLKNPILDTYLKDNSRMNAIINPVTESASVTIRKFSEKPFTIKDLINFKTISKEALVFLSLCFLTDSNILVIGNTGSGKTTTLNVLLSFVPLDERIVVVEEVREINIHHKHKVFTLVNPEIGVTLENLVINTLRMRPDRVVIGEVRTKEESKYLIESMLCGQAKGTYTTFHSQSANEALLRLKSYGVLETDLGVIDLIITQRRYNKYNKGKTIDLRNVTEVCEVIYNGSKITLNKLFEYDIFKERLVKKNDPVKVFEKFKIAFHIKSKKELYTLYKKQEKLIDEVLKKIK